MLTGETITMTRTERLLPKGEPRYVRCYDNGGRSFDRYTIVFSGRYSERVFGKPGYTLYFGASENPFHPQGFGQHGESPNRIDQPTYGHLGRKVLWNTLPADVQRAAMATYRSLWRLE